MPAVFKHKNSVIGEKNQQEILITSFKLLAWWIIISDTEF